MASSRVGTTTSARGACGRPGAGPAQLLQQRDAERQRLAGAGAGLADDVVAGQRDGQGQRLDRERGGDPGVSQRGADALGHPELGEGLLGRNWGTGTGLAGAAAGVATTVTMAVPWLVGGVRSAVSLGGAKPLSSSAAGPPAVGLSGSAGSSPGTLCTISVVRASSLHQWARGRWAHWRARRLHRGLSTGLRRQNGPASPGAARAACSRGPVTAPEQSAAAGGRRTSCHKVHDVHKNAPGGLPHSCKRIPAV